MIDTEDFERIYKHKWKGVQSSSKWYAKRNYRDKDKSRVLAMHRFIMNAQKGQVLDHINGDSLDNRKCNLRFCTLSQNQWAKRKRPSRYSSKYRGVYFDKRCNYWVAQITHNWKKLTVGYFRNEKEAAIARDKKSLELYGSFAQLNFP